MTRVDKLINWFNDECYSLDQCIEFINDHINQYSKSELDELLLRLQMIFGRFIGR